MSKKEEGLEEVVFALIELGKISTVLMLDAMQAGDDALAEYNRCKEEGGLPQMDRAAVRRMNYLSRVYVRAAFAYIEGTLYGLKGVALAAHAIRPCFSEAEVYYLREMKPTIKDSGMVKDAPNYIMEVIKNVKFTFRAIEKAFELETEIRYQGEGWDALGEAVKVRHAVTHPKSVEALAIWDSRELDPWKKFFLVVGALKWFSEHSGSLGGQVSATFPKLFELEPGEVFPTPEAEGIGTVPDDPLEWFERAEERFRGQLAKIKARDAEKASDTPTDPS